MANTIDILINARGNFDQVKSQIKDIQNGFKGIKLPENLGNKLNAQFTGVNKAIEKYQQALSEPVKTKTDLSNLVKSGKEVDDSFKNLLKTIDSIDSKDLELNLDTTKIDELNQKIAQVGEKYQQALGKAVEKNPLDKLIGSMTNDTQLKNLALITKDLINEGDFENAKNRVEELFKSYKKLTQLKGVKEAFGGKEGDQEKAIANLTALKERLEKFLDTASKKVSPIAQEFDQLNNELKEVTTDELEKLNDQIDEYSQQGHQAQETGQQIAEGVKSAGEAAVRAEGEIEQLTQRVQYFFGLQNQIQLFKRVVRDAYETVRELDKSMTETAVVTDFSVGDMWAQLPEYTARAKELGATINDLYRANTLYYQQGLNSAQAMQLGTETLKMARIAGMEAAEATDAMTAALRGFNMELNDTSAQRVNDVYSRLAAVTASDTEEISTAVEKTASLAYSAGMDIEQTSAFLAQIIETTREAPETAGTALKTIIARFGEVKKLSDEGLTTGVDAEGEEIDINKVDGALKTAGISLKEFIAGNESLGDVFLRLSERWDTLSIEQQRYIATMAAGARQQSRFIAMMQNVERTQYLMSEAYNAEGASDIQFGKTLEGLDAMLNQLRDEWQQFTMSMANQEVIKVFVSLLTDLLGIVNKVIDGVGKIGGIFGDTGEGIAKAAASISGFILVFGQASRLIEKGVGIFGKLLSNSRIPWQANLGEKLLKNVTPKKNKQSIFGRIFMPDSASPVEEGIKEGTEKGKAKADAEAKAYNATRAVTNSADDAQEVADGVKEGTEKASAKVKAEHLVYETFDDYLAANGMAKATEQGAGEGAAEATSFSLISNKIKTAALTAWGKISTFINAASGAAGGQAYSAAWASAAGVGILAGIAVATVAGIAFAAKKMADRYESNAKELAENIKNTYTEELEKGTSGLAKIKENEVRFKELAEGVDEYGRNISLTTEEYQEYATLSNEIAEITPDLIVGYTEEGKALIGKAEALDKATKAQEENIKATKEAYASTETLDTLLAGARASNYSDAAFRAAVDTGQFGTEAGAGGLIFGDTAGYRTRLGKAAHDLGQLTNKQLKFLGRDIDFDNLSLDDAKFIQEHTNQLISVLEAQYPKLKEKISESVQSLATEVGTTLETVDPIVDSLNEYLSLEKLDATSLKIPPEMISDVQKELSEMVYTQINSGEDISGEALQKQVRNYMVELRNLTGPFSEYADIQEQVSTLQEQYTEDLAAGKDATTIYNQSAELLVNRLDILAEKYENATGAGAIFYEQLLKDRAAILGFADSIKIDLQSAFNTMEDNFSSTKTALEEYGDAVERDYSDNANSFASIIKDMQEEGASAGKGTRKYRAGAQALLSDKYLDKSTDAINKKLEQIADWFQEGEEGSRSWYKYLSDNADKYNDWVTKDAEGNVTLTAKTDEELEAFAKALGLSTDALQALIEKSEQYLPTQFMDTKQALAALFSGNGGVRGGIQRYDDMTSGQVVYTSKAGLKRSQIAAGIYDYETRHANAEELRSKGVITFDSKYIEAEFHNSMTKVMKAFQIDEGQAFSDQVTELTAKFLQANADADEIVEYYRQMGQIGEGRAYSSEEELRNTISNLQVQGLDELVDPQRETADNTNTLIAIGTAIANGEKITGEATKKAIADAIKKIEQSQKEDIQKQDPNGDMFTGLDRDGKPVDLKAVPEVESGAAAEAVQKDAEENPPKIVAHVETIPDPSGSGNQQKRSGQLQRTIANGDMATGKNEQSLEIIPDTTKAYESVEQLGQSFNASASDGVTAGVVAGSQAGKKRAEQILSNIGATAHVRVDVVNPTISIAGTNGKSLTFSVRAWSQGKNLDSIPALPSYAQGRIKGGKETALTGELGYEVAWFPSQGTSTILGLNGPEMVDLPKDAVVFPHEQSKKILKGNKSRPQLGSHADTVNQSASASWINGGNVTVTTDPKTKKNISKATKSVENIEKTTPIGQRNIELKLSQIADRLGLNMDLIKRYLERPDASEKGLKSQSFYKQYEKDLKRQEKQSLKLEKKYQEQVNSLGKKGKKNANKETISYGKKGKATVNLNKYIKFNKNTGLYELNTNALKKERNKSKRNAIAEAAQKLIDDTTSKLIKQRQTTLDAIQKQEELDKLVDDTFYNWEMELKRIHEIQMQMDTLSKRQTRYQSAYELEQARAQAGFSDANSIPNMIASLERQREVMSQQITLSGEKIKEAQDQVIDLLNPKSTQQKAALGEALKYFSYERRPDGTYDYDINTAALEARYNNGQMTEEEYKKIHDTINNIKAGMDELEDAVNDNLTTLKQVYDTLNDQRQKLADYEQDILKGLQSEIEEEINNQKNISASITDQLKKLYDEVKKGIELRRRAEDNAKTEADIQKKQQRLMMLRANTAGGNSVEIAQLEKEIGEAQQSYQRTLEDQLLQDLQDQADKAAEQRNEQIELTERIADTSERTQELVNKVNEWVAHPKQHEKEIKEALAAAYGTDPQTYYQDLINKAKVQDSYNEIYTLSKYSIPNLTNQIEKIDSTVTGKAITSATTGDGYIKVEPKATTSTTKTPEQTAKDAADAAAKALPKVVAAVGSGLGGAKKLTGTGFKSEIEATSVTLETKKVTIPSVGGGVSAALSAITKRYATGGLNTSTGPAWLDGTPSKPELVLNARDTQNFLALKDILSGIMGNVNTIPDSEDAASNTYEININVDHLNNDYDVDKVAERVKKIIVKDSSYRNVTAVRKFR